ncbi:MAG: UbiX family flavin prenyltransferase, partial [Firmicutes bacterium]|nr:UbiX family flavin prenyltransferase [Bacillota bacterium]
PCSMKSLSGIANAYGSDLLVRAADVCLKENRKVVLVPREVPLNLIHCKNLLAACEAGYIIIPPMLTFYSDYPTAADQVDHIIGKILLQFELPYHKFKPWEGR